MWLYIRSFALVNPSFNAGVLISATIPSIDLSESGYSFPAYIKRRFRNTSYSAPFKTTSLGLFPRKVSACSGDRKVQPKLLRTTSAGIFALYSS